MLFKLKNLSVLAAVVVAGLGAASVRADAVLLNGQFNAGANPGSFVDIAAGDTADNSLYLPNWTVVSGSVDVIGTYFTPPAFPGGGDNITPNGSVDLDGLSPGAISQTISGFTVGDYYALQFDLGANPDGPPDPKQLLVTVTPPGQGYFPTIPPTIEANSAKGSAWDTEILYFQAASATETIDFASQDPSTEGGMLPAYGPVIANVQLSDVVGTLPDTSGTLTAVPLPKSAGVGFSMLGVFGALGILRRKLGSRSRIA